MMYHAIFYIFAGILLLFASFAMDKIRVIRNEVKECRSVWKQDCTMVAIPNSHIDGIVKLLKG